MSRKRTGPHAPAGQELKRSLWKLAVDVRRTVPKDLTTAQAEALLDEFKALRPRGRKRPR